MSLTVRQANQLLRTITEYKEAAIREVWKGTATLEARELLEADLQKKREKLHALVKSFVNISNLEEL